MTEQNNSNQEVSAVAGAGTNNSPNSSKMLAEDSKMEQNQPNSQENAGSNDNSATDSEATSIGTNDVSSVTSDSAEVASITGEVKSYICDISNKFGVLRGVLQSEGQGKSIVYCNTFIVAEWLSFKLRHNGIPASLFPIRENAPNAPSADNIMVWIVTDKTAKYFKQDDVETLINFDFPQKVGIYNERVGKLAFKKMFNLVCENYGEGFEKINAAADNKFAKPIWFPEDYGNIVDKAPDPFSPENVLEEDDFKRGPRQSGGRFARSGGRQGSQDRGRRNEGRQRYQQRDQSDAGRPERSSYKVSRKKASSETGFFALLKKILSLFFFFGSSKKKADSRGEYSHRGSDSRGSSGGLSHRSGSQGSRSRNGNRDSNNRGGNKRGNYGNRDDSDGERSGGRGSGRHHGKGGGNKPHNRRPRRDGDDSRGGRNRSGGGGRGRNAKPKPNHRGDRHH